MQLYKKKLSFILHVCYSNRPPTGKVIIHCGRFSYTFCTPLLILQPPRIEPTTSGLMFRDCCGICVITLDVMIKLSVITENNKSSFIPTYCVNNCTLIQFVMTKKHFSSRHLNVTKKKIFKIQINRNCELEMSLPPIFLKLSISMKSFIHVIYGTKTISRLCLKTRLFRSMTKVPILSSSKTFQMIGLSIVSSVLAVN